MKWGTLIGDVNLDQNTNVIDITNQVSFILDLPEPNFYEFWASDLNQDMNLNVVDVVQLSGHILGLLKSNSRASAVLDEKTLSISGDVMGIQFEGSLIQKFMVMI